MKLRCSWGSLTAPSRAPHTLIAPRRVAWAVALCFFLLSRKCDNRHEVSLERWNVLAWSLFWDGWLSLAWRVALPPTRVPATKSQIVGVNGRHSILGELWIGFVEVTRVATFPPSSVRYCALLTAKMFSGLRGATVIVHS